MVQSAIGPYNGPPHLEVTTMSSSTRANIETVEAIYAAFGRGDVAAILAQMDEQVEWEPGYPHDDDIPWIKSGRGPAHVAAFLGSLQVLGDGPWVVALAALDAVHKPSGRTFSEPCEPHVWKFNAAGKVVSMRHAADTRAQARVAGLPG
jgi:uncharacterized protein